MNRPSEGHDILVASETVKAFFLCWRSVQVEFGDLLCSPMTNSFVYAVDEMEIGRKERFLISNT